MLFPPIPPPRLPHSSFSIHHSSFSTRRTSLLTPHSSLLLALLLPACAPAPSPVRIDLAFTPSAPPALTFTPPDAADPDALHTWRAAAHAALDIVRLPANAPSPAVLHIDWLPAARRRLALTPTLDLRPDAVGALHGSTLALRAAGDPLLDAFRAGHECSHYLLALRAPRPYPLWLDEGLAQLVAYRAAETAARRLSLDVRRTPPPDLASAAYPPEELVALADYPAAPARSAAFYWQSALLVRAIHARLGPDAFQTWLDDLSADPPPPDWFAPLATRYWMDETDRAALLAQALPNPPPYAPLSAAWTL